MNEIMQHFPLILAIHKHNHFVIYICLALVFVGFILQKRAFGRDFWTRVSSFARVVMASAIFLQILMGCTLYFVRNLPFSLAQTNTLFQYWIVLHPALIGSGGILLLGAIFLGRKRAISRLCGFAGLCAIAAAFILMPD